MRREIPYRVITKSECYCTEQQKISGTAKNNILQWNSTTVFLTLWTGSEVSSTTCSIREGGSSTWTWLSPVLPKLRIRLTVPPSAGLLGSFRTTIEGLTKEGDSEQVASPLCAPMLFMTSYPSSNCFSSCSSACLGDRDKDPPPAALHLSSSKVMTGDWWGW